MVDPTPSKGEVWWADLPTPKGSGPGFRRPILVVSADTFNASRIATVVVVALTSNLGLVAAPGNVLLPAGETQLPKDSVANVSQIVTLDKNLLAERAGRLNDYLLAQVESGLGLVLDLRRDDPRVR